MLDVRHLLARPFTQCTVEDQKLSVTEYDPAANEGGMPSRLVIEESRHRDGTTRRYTAHVEQLWGSD